jgi:radical SAM protein with 4Fe4S-binding SPASM domain
VSRSFGAEHVLQQLATASGAENVYLHVLVADRCNHACVHCYQVQGQKGELSTDQLRAVIDAFRARGGMVLSVSGGEATLRPDLVDLLVHARDRGLATIVYTNAYLIDEAWARRFAEARVWRVEVSLYSDVAEEHDAVTRVPGSFERTVEGVRALRAADVNVKLKVVLTRVSSSTAERMRALADRLSCAVQVSAQIAPREDGDMSPVAEAMAPDIVAVAGEPMHARPREEVLDGSPCGAGKSALTVRSDGVLQPCTNVFVELGSAATGVQEGNSEARVFRDLTWKSLHGCRDCDLASLCKRCHAAAGIEAGDMFGPYRTACRTATARYAAATPGLVRVEEPDRRDPEVGPFRVEGLTLRPIPDVLNDEDRAMRDRFPWIHGSGARSGPSKLVTLGRRKAPAAD